MRETDDRRQIDPAGRLTRREFVGGLAVASAIGVTGTQKAQAQAPASGSANAQVTAVLDALAGEIEKSLGKKGPGVFNLPGLMKIKVVRKPATKARKGINRFTGEEQIFKAKPARNVVKVLPLKALKEMV